MVKGLLMCVAHQSVQLCCCLLKEKGEREGEREVNTSRDSQVQSSRSTWSHTSRMSFL